MTSLTERLEAVAAAAASADARAACVVTVITPAESLTLCRGYTDRSDSTPVTVRTRFEIGSVTKTFTALLLAEMAARGEVAYRDRVSDRVPPWAVPGGRGGPRIRLEHLATHTSGLPRLPPGLLRSALPSWYSNPYQAFRGEELLRSLGRTRVRRPPGTRVRYSNLGVGLLGRLLAEQADTDYGALVRERLLRPLALVDTTTDAVPEGEWATGHWHGRPRPPWLIPGLPGAGAMRASARDLSRYLRAHIDPVGATARPALRTALRDTLRPRLVAGDGREPCLVWSRRVSCGGELFFHSGGTRGFTTFVGLSPGPGVAVTALVNSAPTLRGRFVQAAYVLLRALVRDS